MKILLVAASFIGDTILSTPVVDGIRRLHPDASLSIMTTPGSAPLLVHDPRIDHIITFDKRNREKGISGMIRKAAELRRSRFDRVYSLHRSYRTTALLFLAKIPVRIGFDDARLRFLYTRTARRHRDRHAVIANLSILFEEADEQTFDTRMTLYAPEKEQISPATRELTLHLPRPYALLAPGSVWATKQWDISGFFATARYLLDRGIAVVLTGSPGDRETCGQISRDLPVVDLSGKIPLTDTMAMVKNSCLVVCNDSMALHMASAFGTPTVAVFCATSPSIGFGPWKNPNARVVEDNSLACRPCGRHGGMTCPAGTGACMKIPAETVIQAIEQVIDI